MERILGFSSEPCCRSDFFFCCEALFPFLFFSIFFFSRLSRSHSRTSSLRAVDRTYPSLDVNSHIRKKSTTRSLSTHLAICITSITSGSHFFLFVVFDTYEMMGNCVMSSTFLAWALKSSPQGVGGGDDRRKTNLSQEGFLQARFGEEDLTAKS